MLINLISLAILFKPLFHQSRIGQGRAGRGWAGQGRTGQGRPEYSSERARVLSRYLAMPHLCLSIQKEKEK